MSSIGIGIAGLEYTVVSSIASMDGIILSLADARWMQVRNYE